MVLALLALLSTSVRAFAAEAFLAPEQAFALTVDQDSPDHGAVRLNWAIAPGYYLYRDRIVISATPAASLGKIVRPGGDLKNDPNLGATQVYHDAVSISVEAGNARQLQVSWQGCATAGLCYPPQTRTVNVVKLASTTAALPTLLEDSSSNTSNSDSHITDQLARRSLLWTVPMFFLLGLALAFTPCVLPMVPIVSGIVIGSQAAPRRAFALSLAFVLPMASTYALLGVGAALAGANLQVVLQNRWMLWAFGAVFVVLGLAMFGVFTLQLPAPLRDRLDQAGRRRQGGTLAGAAGLGVVSALFVGPCMTAPLAGTLIYIAQSGKVAQGGVLLFALGLGMGVPLLVIGSVGARCLPRPGPWMERVKVALGFMLLGTAIWTVQRALPPALVLALWGGLLVGIALTLVRASTASSTPPEQGKGGGGAATWVLLRSAAWIAALWGSALIVGAAAGAHDPFEPLSFVPRSIAVPPVATERDAALSFETVRSERALQSRLHTARQAGQAVLVDFSADWCVSCKSIERDVFGDPRIQRALAGLVLLRADVSASGSDAQELMRTHQVVGPPTVLLIDAQGQERREARLVGEFTPAELLRLLPAVSRSPP